MLILIIIKSFESTPIPEPPWLTRTTKRIYFVVCCTGFLFGRSYARGDMLEILVSCDPIQGAAECYQISIYSCLPRFIVYFARFPRTTVIFCQNLTLFLHFILVLQQYPRYWTSFQVKKFFPVYSIVSEPFDSSTCRLVSI